MNDFCDKVADLCLKQFYSLPKTGKPTPNEWTILSCIVEEQDHKLNVVALGTGTKCIGNDKLSKQGDILNDSHSEIICRRVFLRYIYENILQKSALFVYNTEKRSFDLKENTKYHFFSTHVPCGDAAIFPKQDTENFGNVLGKRKQETVNTDRKRLKSDIFRTGAKCLENSKQDPRLEGEDYHCVGAVRTKPGRGAPTLSVSCSDKIARWCHIGLQGALLSLLLTSPIYLHSFTICGATPFDQASMKRAFYDRLAVDSCKRMTLGQASLSFIYAKDKDKSPCPSSIAWLVLKVKRQTEIGVDGRKQGVTKKQSNLSGALLISKRELFKLFIQVLKTFDVSANVRDFNKLTYREAKMLSKDYQESWALLKGKFGAWTRKEDTLLDFTVSEEK